MTLHRFVPLASYSLYCNICRRPGNNDTLERCNNPFHQCMEASTGISIIILASQSSCLMLDPSFCFEWFLDNIFLHRACAERAIQLHYYRKDGHRDYIYCSIECAIICSAMKNPFPRRWAWRLHHAVGYVPWRTEVSTSRSSTDRTHHIRLIETIDGSS